MYIYIYKYLHISKRAPPSAVSKLPKLELLLMDKILHDPKDP